MIDADEDVETVEAPDDIRADIAQAMKGADASDGPAEAVEKDVSVSPSESPSDTETSASTDQSKTSEAKSFKAPDHWSSDDKAWLASFSENQQAAVVERFKKIEDGFQPKLQRAAALEKDYSGVDDLFKPYAADMQSKGLTKDIVIRGWAAVEQRFMNGDGANALKEIARNYNIDLSQITGQPAETGEWVDPEIKALREELGGVKQSLEQRQHAEQQQAVSRQLDDIRSFAEAKDASGALAHPHFTDVMDNIMQIVAGIRATGGNPPPLTELYDQAVYANPSTRAKLLAASIEAEKAAAAAAGRARTEAARKAGSSITGSPSPGGSATQPEYKSIREALEAAMHEHRA